MEIPSKTAQRIKANIRAIEIAQTLDEESRKATPEERTALCAFTGWGGLSALFEPGEPRFADERKRLEELLPAKALREAQASILDAYYTPPAVIDALYAGLTRLGFDGGPILEPAAGAGRFLAQAPKHWQAGTEWVAVEKDRTAAAICGHAHPQARVLAQGFEDTPILDGEFAAAVGNPPYDTSRVFDALESHLCATGIHNYFLAKSIAKVRPGGLLAMVVSRFFLDALDARYREKVALKARLLGAFRLPVETFEKTGASVVCDLVFFQRLSPGERGNSGEWVKASGPDDAGATVEGRAVNAWYVRHPEHVLGAVEPNTDRYGRPSFTVRAQGDLKTALAGAIERLPEGVCDPLGLQADAAQAQALEVPETRAKVQGYALDVDSRAVVRLPDRLGQRQWALAGHKGRALARLAGMLSIRDALCALIEAESKDTSNADGIERQRAQLRDTYEAFVKAQGAVNERPNRQAMAGDPDLDLVLALEVDFDKGISRSAARREGVAPKPASWQRADILTRRVIRPVPAPKPPENARDALVRCLREQGRVDVGHMAALLGVSRIAMVERLRSELAGEVFLADPERGVWEHRDRYLSGDIRTKIATVEGHLARHPDLRVNLDALREVLPADIEPADIGVPMGAPWLPGDVLGAFVRHMIEAEPTTTPTFVAGRWYLEVADYRGNATKQSSTWGTPDYPFHKLYVAMLAGRKIEVADEIDGRRVVNAERTTAALAKADEIRAEWADWIWRDSDRRARLARIYNAHANRWIAPTYDGAFLLDDHGRLPGMSEAISLRAHQADAIWRAISERRLLADHVVGAGKTLVGICAAMEAKRMGLIGKACLCVPNHLVGHWASHALQAYPQARVLSASKQDFERANRRRLAARIATGDWDLVIIGHSSFGFIEPPAGTRTYMLEDMVDEIARALKKEGKGGGNTRELERTKKRVETRLKKMLERSRKDDLIAFDRLGVDALVVDEAHFGKNLAYFTRHNGIGGLGPQDGSGRALDLYGKCRWLLGRGGTVIFLTGTPLSNSLVEMHALKRYLFEDELRARGMQHFDAWASQFAEPTGELEMSVTGKWVWKTRFRHFENVPEMMRLYRAFAHVVQTPDLQAQAKATGQRWPVPRLRGGRPVEVKAPRSTDQTAFMRGLLKRAENIGTGDGKECMLQLVSEANMASLDMRLLDPGAVDYHASKVNLAVRNVLAEYHRWAADKGAQLVFCDLGVPGGKRFCVYDDIRDKLIAGGIPTEEIAFAHSARTDIQTQALHEKVRRGEVRVLIGSTEKMGTGMNVQDRLVALHNLDAPWTPASLEQRTGRILRQGNRLFERDPEGFEVAVCNYGTELTLDAFRWATLERKAGFIAQVRAHDLTERRVREDDAGGDIDYGSMKAMLSGNPLVKRHFELTRRIERLTRLERAHRRDQHAIETHLARYSGIETATAAKLEALDADSATLAGYPEPHFERDGKAWTGKAIGEAVVAALELALRRPYYRLRDGMVLGQYRGLALWVETDFGDDVVISLRGRQLHLETEYRGGQRIGVRSLLGRLERLLSDAVATERAWVVGRCERLCAENRESRARLGQPFAQAGELDRLRQEMEAVSLALAESEAAGNEGPPAEPQPAPASEGGLRRVVVSVRGGSVPVIRKRTLSLRSRKAA